MPLFLVPLVNWIGGALAAAFTWFVSRKGIAFTAMTALIAAIGVIIDTLVAETDAMIGSVMPTSIGFVTPFIPDNTAACISIIISCELACTAFKLSLRLIEWKARVMTS